MNEGKPKHTFISHYPNAGLYHNMFLGPFRKILGVGLKI